MLPAIAEVIFIDKLRLLAAHDLAELDRSLVLDLHPEIRIGHANNGPPDNKLVEVRVGPPHHNLEDLVQPRQADIAGRLNASPDRRLALPERHFELVDRIARRLLQTRHSSLLLLTQLASAISASAAQRSNAAAS